MQSKNTSSKNWMISEVMSYLQTEKEDFCRCW